MVVEIYDRGSGFDVDKQRPISPDEYVAAQRERGLGLFIIQKFVDDLQYERGGSAGNCLRLTKRL